MAGTTATMAEAPSTMRNIEYMAIPEAIATSPARSNIHIPGSTEKAQTNAPITMSAPEKYTRIVPPKTCTNASGVLKNSVIVAMTVSKM